MREIERCVEQEKPGILGVSEANMIIDQNLSKVTIPGYRLFTNKHEDGCTIKRLVAYVRQNLNIKLREDLMDEAVTSIWFEIHVKQGRGDAKCLVCQVYREHKIFAIQGSEDMQYFLTNGLCRRVKKYMFWEMSITTTR